MTGSGSKNSSGRMIKPGLRERLKYHFDNFMSRGTLALISGWGILSLVIISVAGATIRLGCIKRSGEILQEVDGVVISSVERKPGYRHPGPGFGAPLTKEGRLSRTGRRGDSELD